MEKPAKTTDRAISMKEYLFWYLVATNGPAETFWALPDDKVQGMVDDFVTFVKKRQAKDVSF